MQKLIAMLHKKGKKRVKNMRNVGPDNNRSRRNRSNRNCACSACACQCG